VILLSRKYTSARIMVTPNEYTHTVTIVTMSVCLRSISKSELKVVAFEHIQTHCVVLDQKSTQIMRKYWQGCQSQGWPRRVATMASIQIHGSQRSTNSIIPTVISPSHGPCWSFANTNTCLCKSNLQEENLLDTSPVLDDPSTVQEQIRT